MTIEEAFGHTLKEFRLNKKFSQEKLALESGLDRTYISLLERGLRQPSLSTIFLLSDALSMTPESFVKRVRELTSKSRK